MCVCVCYMCATVTCFEWPVNAFFLRSRGINKTMPLSHMGQETLCVRVWGPEADIRCFLLLLSTLCFETGSPTKPSTHELARLVGQSPRICKPPCSLNSGLGYWHALLLYLASGDSDSNPLPNLGSGSFSSARGHVHHQDHACFSLLCPSQLPPEDILRMLAEALMETEINTAALQGEGVQL